jgi:hypothetical protein
MLWYFPSRWSVQAGQYLRDNLSPSEIDATWILATSRFDATNIAIWSDSPEIDYELLAPGTQIPIDLVPVGTRYVVTTSDVGLEGSYLEKYIGDGFTLYTLMK